MAEPVTRWTKHDHLPEYLCVEEMAAYLGLSRNGAYSLVRSGVIDSVRFGKLIRVPRSALAPNVGTVA